MTVAAHFSVFSLLSQVGVWVGGVGGWVGVVVWLWVGGIIRNKANLCQAKLKLNLNWAGLSLAIVD